MSSIRDRLDGLTLFRVCESSPLSQVGAALSDGKTALAVNIILREAVRYGWQGNLWHCFLAHTLWENENPFTLLCERSKAHKDTLWQFALADLAVFRDLFRERFDSPAWELLESFSCVASKSVSAENGTAVLAEKLASAPDAEAFAGIITEYFEQNGLGQLGMYHVFRIEDTNGVTLVPITLKDGITTFEELVGYDEQKKLLRGNTEAFIGGQSANNVLLYGDAGTGKSTSIQALLPAYAKNGLRIVEIHRHQYASIPPLIEQLKHRNYRFILFLDDLSFEDNEVEYKALKSVLEGGASAMPDNVRVYATSNRRNLVRESWKDREDMEHNGDIHRSDTMEEKLSLSSRFGLRIFYPAPSFEEYQQIVSALASRSDECTMTADELRAAAGTWQVRNGSRSGRTARQFVDSLSSKK